MPRLATANLKGSVTPLTGNYTEYAQILATVHSSRATDAPLSGLCLGLLKSSGAPLAQK